MKTGITVNFNGKVVAVTGAAGGIGSQIARKFAECGAKVAICDLRNTDSVVSKLNDTGYTAKGYDFNITSREQVAENFEKIKNELGNVDILINNAGVNVGPDERKTVENFSDEWWDRITSVDLTGVYNCSKAAANQMTNGGAILNISSVVGLVPLRNQCAFAAAKAGVANLTKAMAIELAPKNIRVNCVAPGTVMLEITNKLWTADSAMTGLLAHIPMARQAQADEIADPVVFLCSDYASYMTGVVVPVDGGWTAGGYARNF